VGEQWDGSTKNMEKKQRVVAVLPARYASSRFPGKPLAHILGKPMIQWAYEGTAASTLIDEVIVATDDTRIADTVAAFGGKVAMTSPEHKTGTDRIAEAIRNTGGDLIVNVQGDEPLIPSTVLDQLISRMTQTHAEMGTVAVPFRVTGRSPQDPNAVKVVVDAKGFALYFSRSLIPFCRDGGTPIGPLLHWGLYAYTRSFLEQFVSWKTGILEACEMLEQLRAVENGTRILVLESDHQSIGVDVPGDISIVEELLRKRGIRE